MRNITLALLFSVSSLALAHTPVPSRGVEMRNGQYSCAQYEQAIRSHGKIVVTYSFAARAFYANSNSCHFTEIPVARHIDSTDGGCMLRWACEIDPNRNR